jgi:hypothetical protein
VLRFDHLIVAVSDLDAAAARLLDRHGLASTPGGRHEGLGTGNRIVPLGEDYIELMAVVDPDEADNNPLGQWLQAHSADDDRLAALCLRTDDLDAVASRLGLTPLPMSRVKDDGTTLSWRLAGLEPFFIQWDRGSPHPGADPASHRVDPSGIAWVQLGGARDRLREWVGQESLALRVTAGDPGIRAAAIATAQGELLLR